MKKAKNMDEAWKIQETYAGKPHGFVQWKGTDVWMDIKPADRELIRRSPELMAALEDLMQIVEGVRNERWAADGRRLKDTPEWCRLYVLRCAILRGEPNK